MYPAPRKRAGGAVDLEEMNAAPPPRMRVFPFHFSNVGSNRCSFSTPRLVGPAIVKGIELYVGFGVSPPNCTLEIGTAQSPVLESSVANTVARPYSVLLELLDPFNAMLYAAGDGMPLATAPTYTASYERPLDLIVTLPEFYLVLAVPNAGVSVGEVNGKVRILEGVDPEALRFFL